MSYPELKSYFIGKDDFQTVFEQPFIISCFIIIKFKSYENKTFVILIVYCSLTLLEL